MSSGQQPPAPNAFKEGEARQEASGNHMFEMARLAQTDRDAALKIVFDGIQGDPLKNPWGMEVAMIYKTDERRAQTLKGEERTKHFAQWRDYLLRAQTLLQNALQKHPGNASLTYGISSVNEALAAASLGAGDGAKAKEIALQQLAANTNTTDWNYGNVIHNANSTLGRAALREGDKKAAAEFLKKAGATPGSPQLNSFGPDWILAREMIEAGETQAVLDYLDLVEKFWVSRKNPKSPAAKLADSHQQKLDQWRAEVREGKLPDFRP
jgi:hypothetical protein